MPSLVLFFAPATSALSSTIQLKIFRVGRVPHDGGRCVRRMAAGARLRSERVFCCSDRSEFLDTEINMGIEAEAGRFQACESELRAKAIERGC